LEKSTKLGQPRGSEIAAAFKPGDHLSTLGRNLLSCAAALTNSNFIGERKLPARATETGNYAMTKLRALQKHLVLLARTKVEAQHAWERLQSQFAALRLVVNQEKSRLTSVE
jgi:hypothetical protein